MQVIRHWETLITQLLRQMLEYRGRTITLRTDPMAIQSLLERLHPVTNGRPLIRFGPRGDGGYLIPDDIEGISACFSPGVSEIAGFEEDCARQGIEVYLADKSVEKPPFQHDKFHFSKRFVGAYTDSDYITLDDWVNSSMHETESPIMLQMDIEGSEYEAFLSASGKLMKRFRIIVAEFHNINQLVNLPFFNLAARAFEKILHTHTCVHIHPNNYGYMGKPEDRELWLPSGMEFTFLLTDRVKDPVFRTDFPHALDFDNSDFPHLPLPACWFRS